MKKNNKKGFTLAELLIVVAIIAVLTAIAIPVFTNQLEKSREATDLSNARAAYAEVTAAILDGSLTKETGHTTRTISGGLTATLTDTGTGNYSVEITNFPIKQTVEGWATTGGNIAGVSISDTNGKPKAPTCTLKFEWTRSDSGEYLSAVTFS